MVTVFLRGGLGNQMFQYALGMNLAKKNRTELVLDTVFLRDRFPRPNFSYRTFDLDVFEIEPRFTNLSRIADRHPLPGVWLGLDFIGIAARSLFGTQKPIVERDDTFNSTILDVRGNLLLYGRWQNENYFKEIEDDVRTAFRLRASFAGEAAALSEKIVGSNAVSLHVRRGDYVAFANIKKIMGGTDLNYYARAVEYITKHVTKPYLFVFSDDIAWCRDNIKFSLPTIYVNDTSRGPKAGWHMMLMAQCKHNIVTSSTFSWWGAWLNDNPKKIVVAPKNWYTDSSIKENVVPERWIKL